MPKRAASMFLTGVPELDKKLEQMERKAGNRVARNTLGAGARVVQKAIKAISPAKIKDSVGMRNEKSRRSGKLETKVGINVGKRSKTRWAQWAPLIVLGSKFRTRKTIGGLFSYIKNPTAAQLATGVIPKTDIVNRGVAASKGSADSAMNKAFKRSLEREIAKAKLNKG